ncbi:MAG TPA: nucleoside-diphosphate sugar epimerase/dehydratase [Spirochaetota bacterium]|nr:nucleoside-diphosphate sugar epimerase/dehydratase [Spirochaetota bacterium]
MPILYAIRGKRLIYVILDALGVAGSFAGAYALLPGSAFQAGRAGVAVWAAIACAAYLAAFYLFQIYRVIWHYSDMRDMYRLLAANIAGMAAAVAAAFAFGMEIAPVWIVLMFLLAAGFTVLYRVIVRDRLGRKSFVRPGTGEDGAPKSRRRILIVGAGDAGRMILSEYARRGWDRDIVGFADDDYAKTGRIIGGKRILCTLDGMGRVMRRHEVTEAIVAMPSAGTGAIDRAVAILRRETPDIVIKTLPVFTKIFEKSLSPDLCEVGIAELLGREEFAVDAAAMQERFAGKTVLVTGAGGSIGSELCRQLLKFRVARLVAVGRGEFSIYALAKTLEEELYYLDNGAEIAYRIVDVKDRRMLDGIFERYRPEIVIHAAAHKHVPLMEFNETEALQNNVLGSRNVFDAAHRFKAEECVMVSTDKAVRPVNVMGASKRIAELVAMYYYLEKGLRTSIVRFGNVIGSRGSVIPLFREQILKGGPVTVTHPEVRRYFMSIPEASILVLNAAAYASGGEIFALDMGKQYRVADVAQSLIRLFGYVPERDIRIEYTGLRPGEKLYEELFYDPARISSTDNARIFMLNAPTEGYDRRALEAFIADTIPSLHGRDALAIREAIRAIVPEYEFDVPGVPRGRARLVT